MTDVDIVRLAAGFSQALDDDSYDVLRTLLSADCQYHSRTAVIVGPDAIIDSYRDQNALARRLFDRVEYSSSVTKGGPASVSVVFTDKLYIRDRAHLYRCRQILHFAADGLIDSIKHEELPAERERLLQFCAENGVKF